MGLLDLLFRTICVGCGALNTSLCARCEQSIHRTNRPILVGTASLPTWSGARYDAALRKVVLAAKQTGRTQFLDVMAQLVARAITLALVQLQCEGAVGLVPIVSGKKTRQSSGLDIASEICRRAIPLAAIGGVELVRILALSSRQGDVSQKQLGRADRAANVRGKFTVHDYHRLVGLPLLIVDDVVTTGATIESAASVLRRAGGNIVGAVVACDRPTRV